MEASRGLTGAVVRSAIIISVHIVLSAQGRKNERVCSMMPQRSNKRMKARPRRNNLNERNGTLRYMCRREDTLAVVPLIPVLIAIRTP